MPTASNIVSGAIGTNQEFDSIILDIANQDVTIDRAGTGIGRITTAIDAVSQEILRLESTRATRADEDNVYGTFYMPDDGGTLVEFARIVGIASDVTAAFHKGALAIQFKSGTGTLTEAVRFGTADGTLAKTVFNDDGFDLDHIFEGDNEAFLLVLDAGNDVVAIGGETVSNIQLHIERDTDETSTEILRLSSSRATRAADDELAIGFRMPDSGGTQTEFGRITLIGTNITDTTERGMFEFETALNLTATRVLRMGFETGGAFQFGFGTSLATRATYTPSNVTTDRTYDANATSLDEIADILGTLIADLKTHGVLL